MLADVGFTDAAERQAKLRLAYALNRVLDARKLSQDNAAKVLGVTQPGESARRHYKLATFSFGRLMHLLTLLDKDVEIVIRREPRIAEGWPDRRHRGLIAAINHADAYDIGRALEEHSMARNRKAVVQKRQPFKKARRRAVARLRAGLDLEWTPERTREKLHERG